MARQRFKERKRDSFFGSFVYEQVVPKDHLLVKLNENEVVPWQRFTYKLVKYYRMPSRRTPPLIVQLRADPHFTSISLRTQTTGRLFSRPRRRSSGGSFNTLRHRHTNP